MGILATQKPAYVILCLCIFMGVLISTRVLDLSKPISEIIYSRGQREARTNESIITESPKHAPRPQLVIPLNCTVAQNQTRTCPRNYPTSFQADDHHPAPSCPDYFRWIHEDLRPWKATGITDEMIARARPTACFRLTIVDGRVYIEQIRPWWQSRAELNIWGILQLLRRYPGKLPDLVLMFDCEDRPAVFKKSVNGTAAPPPLFTYCADDQTLDIVFPDWSFWGWPEIDIKPWESLSKELEESNKKIKWTKRKPYAYWKGNPDVAGTRQDLMKCNVSEAKDWKARLYKQDWLKEVADGFKESNLARECTHRYKIYIEGNAWSVSGKYILACDSLTLIVTPHYYDFFTRGLTPLQDYWPVNERTKCKSIKYAVEWGESHKKKAVKIGRSSTKFILEDLKMDYVYDYMFHLLNEYAKLLKFKPTVPQSAVEYCSETMACEAQGIKKNFMMDSLEKGPALTNPCTMPPPYNPKALSDMMKQRRDSIKKVEKWENSYW